MTDYPDNLTIKDKYLSISTFKKNGEKKSTPVWYVAKDKKLYIWTADNSWKIKRIKNNNNVEFTASNFKGEHLKESLSGTARIMDKSEEKFPLKLFKDRYGFQYTIFRLMGKLQRSKNIFIEITPQ